MSRRAFGFTVFYGLGVASAMLAMTVLLPLLTSGSPLGAGEGVAHAVVEDGAAACPYLASPGAAPLGVLGGQGARSVCPYLAGRGSACPYLRERGHEGSTVTPMQPEPEDPHGEGWFDRTPRPRMAALLQVEHPSGHELPSAGWF